MTIIQRFQLYIWTGLGELPWTPRAPDGERGAGPVFRNQDGTHIVPPDSEVWLPTVSASAVPRNNFPGGRLRSLVPPIVGAQPPVPFLE